MRGMLLLPLTFTRGSPTLSTGPGAGAGSGQGEVLAEVAMMALTGVAMMFHEEAGEEAVPVDEVVVDHHKLLVLALNKRSLTVIKVSSLVRRISKRLGLISSQQMLF